ncbi:MAG: GNAT family N-acetyltransferase [Litorimonas sp.]
MAGPLTLETVAMGDLDARTRDRWLELRSCNPAFESPYHHPDYHALVERHQGNVRVTTARRSGEIVALLPWQGGAFARPSGAPLSDYQAVIGEDIGVAAMLHGQTVGAFHYTAMTSDGDAAEETARMELSDADSWRSEQSGSYRRHLKSTRRRTRKAEEDIGAPRIVTQCRDVDVYDALIGWKRAKFRDTGKYDVLANPANNGLLRELWERGPGSGLRADLHALHFGERLVACDLGLTDGRVFHSWIVGYDPDMLPYAPGIQLLEGVIDAASALGYGVIDLGAGKDGYKRHYATHPRRVGAGVVTLSSPAGLVAAGYDWIEHAMREKTGDALGKLRRRYSQIAACEPRLSGRSAALAQAVASRLKQPSH